MDSLVEEEVLNMIYLHFKFFFHYLVLIHFLFVIIVPRLLIVFHYLKIICTNYMYQLYVPINLLAPEFYI